MVWRGVLVIDLWRIAYIWHAIYISFLKGIVLARDVLLPLAKLLRVLPADLVVIQLSDPNHDILRPLTTKSFAGIKIALE